jgi:hypothetical protein
MVPCELKSMHGSEALVQVLVGTCLWIICGLQGGYWMIYNTPYRIIYAYAYTDRVIKKLSTYFKN